jgi:PAS domain S-box-containing protein
MMSGFIDRGATHAQTHQRLEAIIATAMDAIISIDESQRIICFNPAAERMFGITADEVMGTPIERFIPERYHAQHRGHIDRFSATGETGRSMGALGAINAVRADGEEFPVEASISQAQTGHERISTVILRDITERIAFEEAQALLAREVDHRAKNILAIVSSLVSLTQAPTREAYAESLAGRIAAMSRAHGLLARGRWQGASLLQAAEDEISTYVDPASFTCNGPDLKLSARAVQPVSMLIHELATNAVKYGALSRRGGHIDFTWRKLENDGVEMIWRERGGPEVVPPAQPGFGTSLIQQIAQNQLCGEMESLWNKEGYELKLILPESVLQISADRPAARSATIGKDIALSKTADRKGSDDIGTLLIVEDEPLLAMQMSKSLAEFGWSIVGVAGSIDEANRLLSDSRNKMPDVAILDVDLAGMPVFPLARSLRKLGIPFLFCTGYEDLEYVQEFASCRSIRKPATVLQIVRGLRDVVRNTQTGLSIQPS